MPILKSLIWLGSRHKQDSKPGSSALEANALTTRPKRRSICEDHLDLGQCACSYLTRLDHAVCLHFFATWLQVRWIKRFHWTGKGLLGLVTVWSHITQQRHEFERKFRLTFIVLKNSKRGNPLSISLHTTHTRARAHAWTRASYSSLCACMYTHINIRRRALTQSYWTNKITMARAVHLIYEWQTSKCTDRQVGKDPYFEVRKCMRVYVCMRARTGVCVCVVWAPQIVDPFVSKIILNNLTDQYTSHCKTTHKERIIHHASTALFQYTSHSKTSHKEMTIHRASAALFRYTVARIAQLVVCYNNNNECISRALFHVKHAQLCWTSANTKLESACI